MAVKVGGYVGAKACTGGPTAGCKSLMGWYLAVYSGRGGTNLGIYNCRSVRGGSTTSLHGEGRAADLGCPTSGQTWSWELAKLLVAYSDELGIQCVIHYQPGVGPRIWSSSYAAQGWRRYTGVADHKNHLHVELIPQAATALSVERIVSVLGTSPGTSEEDDLSAKAEQQIEQIWHWIRDESVAGVVSMPQAILFELRNLSAMVRGNDPDPAKNNYHWVAEVVTAAIGAATEQVLAAVKGGVDFDPADIRAAIEKAASESIAKAVADEMDRRERARLDAENVA